ncbi:MAG: ribosome maturation factor RimP [Proteobacteria bacterium]|nr:ribosome maturation factor RimP [Pseudomonadota bacterium]
MDLKEIVTNIVESQFDADNVFVVDVEIKGKLGNQKILVFIDGDNGVTVDECSKISRGLSNELEEKDIIEGKYLIEVSSPGGDRPLTSIRQYSKHIGRELELVTKDNKKYQGRLLDVINEEIEISIKSGKIKKELNSQSLKVPIKNIDEARVVIRF